MKKIVKKNQEMRTLKLNNDVWNDRPKIECEEPVPSKRGIFNQNVVLLNDSSQILHVCLSNDVGKLDFVFHESGDVDGDGRLDEMQRVKVNK